MNGRNRELFAHLALALARYEKELKFEGVPVPREVAFLRTFVMDCATPRQGAPPLGAGENVPDAEAMANNPMLTKRETASALRVSVRTVDRLVASGALPTVKILGGTRVRRTDLEKYIQSLGEPTSFRDDVTAKDSA